MITKFCKNGCMASLRKVWLSMFLLLFLCGCSSLPKQEVERNTSKYTNETVQEIVSQDVNEVTDKTYVILNENQPEFESEEKTTEEFENYSELDSLGRCGVAYANVCEETMPTEDRESIGQVKPSGWHTVKYDMVDGKYLYNRCHLIGYQLTGENANEENLITGTRSFNVEGMLPFENEVAEYVLETGNHVLYRVTPVYDGDDLVAKGVQMEGYSVEDKGNGVCFNVFVYNVQPGITINYETGESHLSDKPVSTEATTDQQGEATYILNTNTMKIHLPDCSSAKDTKPQNRKDFTGTKEEAQSQGYTPCGRCHP